MRGKKNKKQKVVAPRAWAGPSRVTLQRSSSLGPELVHELNMFPKHES